MGLVLGARAGVPMRVWRDVKKTSSVGQGHPAAGRIVGALLDLSFGWEGHCRNAILKLNQPAVRRARLALVALRDPQRTVFLVIRLDNGAVTPPAVQVPTMEADCGLWKDTVM